MKFLKVPHNSEEYCPVLHVLFAMVLNLSFIISLWDSLKRLFSSFGFLFLQDGFLERLSSSEFVSLSREVENFMAETESVCGRASVSLRGSLQSQVSDAFHSLHHVWLASSLMLMPFHLIVKAPPPSSAFGVPYSILDSEYDFKERM